MAAEASLRRPTTRCPFLPPSFAAAHPSRTSFLPPSPLLLLLFVISLSLSPSPAAAPPSPCPSSLSSFQGFTPLPPNSDFPGNNLQYIPRLTLPQCLQACLSYTPGACLMVSFSTAGECWLKDAISASPASNLHMQSYALPCNFQETCGTDLCSQSVGPTSVDCHCMPASDLGYTEAAPFNAWFDGSDVTWGGSSVAADSLACVQTCVNNSVCVLAQFYPGSRRCLLKSRYDTTNYTADAQVQAYVNACAKDNGNCNTTACSSGPPPQCIDPNQYGFSLWSQNLGYPGNDILSYPNMDSSACISACANIPNCKVAQVDTSALHCFLKSRLSTPVATSYPSVTYFRQ